MRINGQRQRKKLRLERYDYAQAGAYFVTVVAQHRLCLFGEIVEDEMYLNDAGKMIVSSWNGLTDRFPTILLDRFVVMPNHLHGIVVLEGDYKNRPYNEPENDPRRGEPRVRPVRVKPADARPHGTADGSLGRIIQALKSLTTHAYIQGVRNNGWQPFDKRLWQRNYYDHVIRNEGSLNEIRRYIDTNPLRWQLDKENPYSEPGRLQESPLRDNRDS